jgi:hypothetical protein
MVRKIMIAAFTFLALGAGVFGAMRIAGISTGEQVPAAAIYESVPAVSVPEQSEPAIQLDPEPELQAIQPETEIKQTEPVISDLPEPKLPPVTETKPGTARKDPAPSRVDPKSAAKAKPVVQEPAASRKPAPTKPEPRKRVTLDDLLRDN